MIMNMTMRMLHNATSHNDYNDTHTMTIMMVTDDDNDLDDHHDEQQWMQHRDEHLLANVSDHDFGSKCCQRWTCGVLLEKTCLHVHPCALPNPPTSWNPSNPNRIRERSLIGGNETRSSPARSEGEPSKEILQNRWHHWPWCEAQRRTWQPSRCVEYEQGATCAELSGLTGQSWFFLLLPDIETQNNKITIEETTAQCHLSTVEAWQIDRLSRDSNEQDNFFHQCHRHQSRIHHVPMDGRVVPR